MTVCLKSAFINGYSVTIEQDKYSTMYRVTICERQADNLYGYPIAGGSYATMKQALNRFYALSSRAKKGTI